MKPPKVTRSQPYCYQKKRKEIGPDSATCDRKVKNLCIFTSLTITSFLFSFNCLNASLSHAFERFFYYLAITLVFSVFCLKCCLFLIFSCYIAMLSVRRNVVLFFLGLFYLFLVSSALLLSQLLYIFFVFYFLHLNAAKAVGW